MDAVSRVQRQIGKFGLYQMRVLLATQLGYLAVTGSLLTALYDTLKPNDSFNCTNYNSTPVNVARFALFDAKMEQNPFMHM